MLGAKGQEVKKQNQLSNKIENYDKKLKERENDFVEDLNNKYTLNGADELNEIPEEINATLNQEVLKQTMLKSYDILEESKLKE